MADTAQLTPALMQALGQELSATLDKFQVKDPQTRIVALMAVLYGEAATARWTERRMVDTFTHLLEQHADNINVAIQAHNTHKQEG